VTESAQPLARFDRVRRVFGQTVAVDDVSLDIVDGEFLTLLGASGCGKTTLLRMLAGFETPDSGRVVIAGQDMAAIPPYRRPVNMMFQSYALFPHLTVAENIAFGLKQERMVKPAIGRRVAEMLDLVHLAPLAERKPHQLSGGQAQRAALARSLAKHPRLLLLDEPLAALDRAMRERTQFELMDIQRRVGITFVMVTHDQEEAMTMSSRIAVMDAGKIVQVGRPAEIYENPASRFVASFVGAANILEGRVLRAEKGSVEIDIQDLGPVRVLADDPPARGERCAIAIRPEKILLAPPAADANAAHGHIVEVGYMGGLSVFHVRIGKSLLVRIQIANRDRDGVPPSAGTSVILSWPIAAGILLRD